ncbi:MAG: dTDP-4-dehydrorhamnose 3,5-epimerase family protein [Fimbriimonadales bacterium]|nr:dTDP-4-dehydrorhamnose 3,5-epimerase family protein [Fimbriimonadales bacterium]
MDRWKEASKIPGVVIRALQRYEDHRGWLTELFREDELPEGFEPVMGYLSVTHAGVARGPHEHVEQSDGFVFLSGEFELHLWENRPGHQDAYEVHRVGEAAPVFVIVPPGVVHAYRNVGQEDAFVLNFPDRLYRGPGKQDPVDEIRHEDDVQSRFKL